MRFCCLNLLIFTVLIGPLAQAEEAAPAGSQPEAESQRSTFFAPLINFYLPGTTHIYYGQYAEGATHFGIFAGLTYAKHGVGKRLLKSEDYEATKHAEEDSYEVERLNLFNKDYLWLQSLHALSKVNEGLAVYDTFRDAVETYKGTSEFDFLGERESKSELLSAPYQFQHITQPTTWGYLLAQGLSTYFFVDERLNDKDRYHRSGMQGRQAAASLVMNYGAGVGEETVYRGWLMPMVQQKTGSRWGANIFQALLFGYTHHDSNLAGHAAFGLYSGWLVQRNKGQLSESIFAHSWGNMLGHVGAYLAVRSRDPEAARNVPIWLPEVSILF